MRIQVLLSTVEKPPYTYLEDKFSKKYFSALQWTQLQQSKGKFTPIYADASP